MNTVIKELVHSYWNGKFEIYKLKQFSDNRGMVCETFRLDDAITSQCKMCYISETESFIIRGPHQHESQDDNFISWKNKMIYEMYNPENGEFRHFITDKNEIYLVVVKPPIIHAYRNLERESIKTLNYPTSLFMGEGKKEEIDEIRHEVNFENNRTIVVFGATGRLGNALVDSIYDNLGYFKADVIPIFDKCNNKDEVKSLMEDINNKVKNKDDVVFINCAAKTDTSKNESMVWPNSQLPLEFAIMCEKFNFQFIHISTDYVFQKSSKYNVSLSNYTISKQLGERNLKNFNYPKTTILRVANLFSTKEDDFNNMIYKFWTRVKANETINIDPRIVVCPTSVERLSSQISNMIIENDHTLFCKELTTINIVPDRTFNLPEFLSKFFEYSNIENKKSLIEPWFDDFNKGRKITVYNSEYDIMNVINKLKGE